MKLYNAKFEFVEGSFRLVCSFEDEHGHTSTITSSCFSDINVGDGPARVGEKLELVAYRMKVGLFNETH